MNDALRVFIDAFIRVSAVLFRFALFLRLRSHRWNQARLRRKYEVSPATPIRGYDSQRLSNGPKAVYAFTSGSTKDPKKIPYDRKRLLRTQFVFIDTFWRYLAETPLRNRSIFIFSSMKRDDSLTSLLLQTPDPPSYLIGLHAPHLIQNHRSVREAARRYGETAVRLWIPTVSIRSSEGATPDPEIATLVESKLSEFNGEFKSKIESRRLGHMKLEVLTLSDFIQRVGGPEAQFKCLPLYTKLWETQSISVASGS